MRLKTIFVMANILASSNTAPLDSHNLLYYRYYYFQHFFPETKCLHLGARTDWPVFCCSCWGKAIVTGPAT
jgi:hypothetical protein